MLKHLKFFKYWAAGLTEVNSDVEKEAAAGAADLLWSSNSNISPCFHNQSLAFYAQTVHLPLISFQTTGGVYKYTKLRTWQRNSLYILLYTVRHDYLQMFIFSIMEDGNT